VLNIRILVGIDVDKLTQEMNALGLIYQVKNFVFDINLLYTEKDEPHPQVVLALGL
jgi:hypothetical protein